MYIPFGSMVKFQPFAQFSADPFSHSVRPCLVFLLHLFATFTYYVINRDVTINQIMSCLFRAWWNTPRNMEAREFNNILLRHCDALYNQNTIVRWTKWFILPFPKKGDFGIVKNYRGITLISIAAKIYNALLCKCTEPKIGQILRKNQNGFQRNRFTISEILTI